MTAACAVRFCRSVGGKSADPFVIPILYSWHMPDEDVKAPTGSDAGGAQEAPPPEHVELSEGRKGVVLMPVQAVPEEIVVSQIGGLPALAPTAEPSSDNGSSSATGSDE